MITVTNEPSAVACKYCLEECLRTLKRPSELVTVADPVFHWQADDMEVIDELHRTNPLGEGYRFTVRTAYVEEEDRIYYHFTVIDRTQTLVHWQQYATA